MTLANPTRLVEVLGRLDSESDGQAAAEQRRFTRFSVRAPATLEPMEGWSQGTDQVPVMARNISRGGVGFVAERPLPAGSVWRIAFERRGRQVGSQTMVVLYCREIQKGTYLLGGQFIVEPGLMLMLGVDDTALNGDIRIGKAAATEDADFAAPDDVT